MLKRFVLAILLVTGLVLPGFADTPRGIGPNESESSCNNDVLGVFAGDAELTAMWSVNHYNCPAGEYLNADAGACRVCPAGDFCGGIEIDYTGENEGVENCETGWTSDEGSKLATDCYKSGTRRCDEVNAYTAGHGTAEYANETTPCKTFYGSEECGVLDASACNIVKLNCDIGYEDKADDDIVACVWNGVVCDAGTYLPGGATTCAICTNDHYCPGETFNLSDQDQGIFACADVGDSLVAPRGARNETDCGHILHVGDDTLYLYSGEKRSEHVLVVKIGDNEYYGATTPVVDGVAPTPINQRNPDARTLRITIDGAEYYVHEPTYYR